MSQIDWSNREERNAYYRKKEKAYRKDHPRLNLTFTYEEHQLVRRSASQYGIPDNKLARHARLLLLEAARLGLGEQVERPPQLSKEVVDDLTFLLDNIANNCNQIAKNLNTRALETHVVPAAGEAESRLVLDEIFKMLKQTRAEIKTLTTSNNPTS